MNKKDDFFPLVRRASLITNIINKTYLRIGFFDDTWDKYHQIVLIYRKVKLDFRKIVDDYYKYSNYKNYPNKKAFHQLIPEIIKLKLLINQFLQDWEVFLQQYQIVKKLYKERQYYQVTELINKKSINIKNDLYSLFELALYAEEASEKIYLYSSIDLECDFEYLNSLYKASKTFAFKYSQTKSSAITKLKIELFTELSEGYKERDFGNIDSNFWDFIENTNFVDGTYTDLHNITYDSYFIYWLKENEQKQKNWIAPKTIVTKFDQESPLYPIYQKKKIWCKKRGWSELFFQDDEWYAFPPEAVIPLKIPFSKWELFVIIVKIIGLLILFLFLICVVPIFVGFYWATR